MKHPKKKKKSKSTGPCLASDRTTCLKPRQPIDNLFERSDSHMTAKRVLGDKYTRTITKCANESRTLAISEPSTSGVVIAGQLTDWYRQRVTKPQFQPRHAKGMQGRAKGTGRGFLGFIGLLMTISIQCLRRTPPPKINILCCCRAGGKEQSTAGQCHAELPAQG